MSNLVEAFRCAFYEETRDDMILLEFLNRRSQKKFRGQKVKELAMEYLRLTNPDVIKQIEKDLDKPKIVKNNEETTISAEKEIPQNKTIKGMETWS